MRSLSEIETATKRATRAVGFSWGNSEEVGKCIRLLELFGLPGIQNLNQYYKDRAQNKFENLSLIKEKKYSKKIEFKVSNESAWEVGLACGGEIAIFLEVIN